MRKMMNWTMPLLAFVLIFSSCVSKKKYTDLMNDKTTIEESLSKAKKKVTELEDEIKTLEEEKSKLAADYAADKTKWDSELKRLEGELTTAKNDLAAAEKAAKEREEKVIASVRSVFSPYEAEGITLMSKNGKMYLALSQPIKYRSGSTRITKEQKPTIEAIANILKNNPTIGLIVEGHADNVPVKDGAEIGSNMALSIARANRVVKKLVKMGANANQLTAVGRGSSEPAIEGDNAANRRTEFMIVPDLTRLYHLKASGV